MCQKKKCSGLPNYVVKYGLHYTPANYSVAHENAFTTYCKKCVSSYETSEFESDPFACTLIENRPQFKIDSTTILTQTKLVKSSLFNENGSLSFVFFH